MDWPSKPVLLPGVPAASYHRDAFGDVPTLSRSIAHMGITVSWRHAAAAHPRLAGTITRRESEEMDLGSLVHALLLGGLETIDVHDVPDWRGKRADLRDGSRAAGKVPIKLGDFQRAAEACEILKPAICQAVEDVLGGPGEEYIVLGGDLSPVETHIRWSDFGRELVALWEEEPLRGMAFEGELLSVRCRARWDLFLPGAALIADLKVVTGGRWAQAAPFVRQLNTEADSGAMQASSYLRGLAAVHPETAGRGTFVFLRAEPYPPYSVVPIVVTEGLRQLGEERWMRGVAGWAKCMASGVWPGPGVAYAQAESWAVERELQHALEGEGDAEA